MAKENKRLGRWLLSVLIVIVAAACILYGVAQIALSSSLSSKNMHALADGMNVGEYMDRPMLVKTVNTVIYRWTKAFSSSSIYITEADLPAFCSEETVKECLGNLFTEIGKALKKGGSTSVTAQQLLPLMDPVRRYVGEKLGVTITDEMCMEELNKGVLLGNLNGTYPKAVRLGLGLALIGAAVLLLAVMLFLRRENLFVGGFYLALSCGLPGLVLIILSKTLTVTPAAIGAYFPGVQWLQIYKKCMSSTGLITLLAAVLGIGLMVAYVIDKKRVQKLSARKRKEEDLL